MKTYFQTFCYIYILVFKLLCQQKYKLIQLANILYFFCIFSHFLIYYFFASIFCLLPSVFPSYLSCFQCTSLLCLLLSLIVVCFWVFLWLFFFLQKAFLFHLSDSFCFLSFSFYLDKCGVELHILKYTLWLKILSSN